MINHESHEKTRKKLNAKSKRPNGNDKIKSAETHKNLRHQCAIYPCKSAKSVLYPKSAKTQIVSTSEALNPKSESTIVIGTSLNLVSRRRTSQLSQLAKHFIRSQWLTGEQFGSPITTLRSVLSDPRPKRISTT